MRALITNKFHEKPMSDNKEFLTWFMIGRRLCCHTSQSNNIAFNTLRPRQNGRHFADDIYKCIFLNENVWISIKISLKFVLRGSINNIPVVSEACTHYVIDVVSSLRCLTRLHELAGPILLTRKQWASYQIRKIASCACAGNAANVLPDTDFKGNRSLATPACITARASRDGAINCFQNMSSCSRY